ncbi:MAG: hypothetical protein RLZ55_629 [Actinomycetota bacterium]|jgi:hypothetical protein
MRRAVGGALDATVGRAGQVAMGIGDATAREILEDLEPYLIEHTIPTLVDGVTGHLAEVTVPAVVAGATPQLVEQSIPAIVDGLTPYLRDELIPTILDDLTVQLSTVTVPAVVAGATPQLVDSLVPQIVDGIRPYLEQELVPAVVDAVTPHIIDVVAPRIVDGLMPKIRSEVVPAVLDDIVDDPRVRTLIREQSQAMILDGTERFHRVLAKVDDVVERIVRRLTLRQPKLPNPLAPPGRSQVDAGIATRVLSTAIDLGGGTLLVSIGVSSLLSVLGAIFGESPKWLVAFVAFLGFCMVPLYLAVCWSALGRTAGDVISGCRLTRMSGTPLGFGVALVRAFLLVTLLPVWSFGLLTSAYSAKRRVLLDLVTGAEAPYVARFIWEVDDPTQLEGGAPDAA